MDTTGSTLPTPANDNEAQGADTTPAKVISVPALTIELSEKRSAKREARSQLEAEQPAPKADVISFADQSITRDKRMIQLEQMLDEAVLLVRERQKYAILEPDRQAEAEYIKQWALGVSAFTKLLAASEKRTQFLRKDK